MRCPCRANTRSISWALKCSTLPLATSDDAFPRCHKEKWKIGIVLQSDLILELFMLSKSIFSAHSSDDKSSFQPFRRFDIDITSPTFVIPWKWEWIYISNVCHLTRLIWMISLAPSGNIFIATERVVGFPSTSPWTQKVLEIHPFTVRKFCKGWSLITRNLSVESTTSTTHTPITYALLSWILRDYADDFYYFSHQRAADKSAATKENEMRAWRMRRMSMAWGGMRWRDSIRLAEDLPLSGIANIRSLPPREFLNSGFPLSVDDDEKFMIFHIKSGADVLVREGEWVGCREH